MHDAQTQSAHDHGRVQVDSEADAAQLNQQRHDIEAATAEADVGPRADEFATLEMKAVEGALVGGRGVDSCSTDEVETAPAVPLVTVRVVAQERVREVHHAEVEVRETEREAAVRLHCD